MDEPLCVACIYNMRIVGVRINKLKSKSEEITMSECLLHPDMYNKLSNKVKFDINGYPELLHCTKRKVKSDIGRMKNEH